MSLSHWIQLTKNELIDKGLDIGTVTNNGATFVNSGIESCYSFNGSSNYMTISNTNISGNNISAACWIYYMSSANTYNYFISLNGSGGYTDHQIGIAAENNVIHFVAGGNSSLTYTIQYNTWIHLAVTFDGNTIIGYVNGENIGSVSHTTSLNKTNLTLGARCSGTNTYTYFGNCKLSDVRIYDHTLSENEIKQLAKGLRFHLKFDNTDNYDCSGFNVPIQSQTSNFALNTNTARYSNSLTFNSSYIRVPDILTTGIKAYSISVWLRPTVNQTGCIWNGRTTTGKSNAIFYLSGGIRFDDDGSMTQAGSLTLNQWNHVVCTYKNGGKKYIYINGIKVGEANAGAISHTNTYASIGMSQAGDATPSGNNFAGQMSDYRIYRTELSQNDVLELYKVGASIDNFGKLHCYELVE